MTQTAIGNNKLDDLSSLTPRESELLRKAGDRIFALSRRLADSESQTRQLQQELSHVRELLSETRRSRDLLSLQVTSLQRDVDREFEERSELRRLLASLQLQLQAMLPSIAPRPEAPWLSPGRAAPQRGSTHGAPDRTHELVSNCVCIYIHMCVCI